MAFKARYTQEQKRAIVAAQVDHQCTAKRTVELAAAGQLPGIGHGLAPFEIPLTTARTYAGTARRRRRATEVAASDPTEILRRGLATLATDWHRATEHHHRQTARGKHDPDQTARLAKAGREIDQLARGLNRATPHSPAAAPATTPNGQPPDAGAGPDFIGTLTDEP